MKKRSRNQTTNLPLSLSQKLQEIKSEKDDRYKLSYKKNDRKEKRKEARIAKKQKVHKPFHSTPKPTMETLKVSHSVARSTNASNSSPAPQPSMKQDTNPKKPALSTQLQKLKQSNPGFYSLLSTSNLIPTESNPKLTDIDKEIALYAKKLKLKDGMLDKTFTDDGLDFLLGGEGDDVDFTKSLGGKGEESGESEFDDEEDEEMNENAHLEEEFDEDGMDLDESGLEEFGEMDDVDDEVGSEDEDMEDDAPDGSDSAESADFEGLEDEEFHGIEEETPKELPMKQKTNSTMSIYGENHTKNTGTYVPPHLRNSTPSDRLKKHLQGLLNRLSDSNMDSIVQGVLEILSQNSRHDTTLVLTELLLKSVEPGRVTDGFAMTTGSFVAILFNLIGMEFGAHFIQTLVEQYQHDWKLKLEVEDTSAKKLVNYITLLGNLYNFQVVGCGLVYDIIRQSIAGLSELDVEILLKLVKVCGHQLRTDDPTALKDIVVMLLDATSKLDPKDHSLRLKFMVETIIDIKNNKRSKAITQTLDIPKQKKIIQSIIQKRSSRHVEPLGVTIKDIEQIDVKGKWWLVGAAWKGNDDKSDIVKTEHGELYELAKKQRMNTDIRKSIFVVIMSSQDFVDAFEKLLKLNLKDKQQRDIIRVLFHCCQNERVYNPYYTFIANEFCKFQHGYKITVQYTLWDFFKEMDDSNSDDEFIIRVSNLARMYGDLTVMESTPLSILKTLNITSLTQTQALFLKIFLKTVLTSKKPDSQVQSAFVNLSKQADLHELRTGLLYFVKTFFRRRDYEGVGIKEEDFNLVDTRVKNIKEILTSR